MWAHVVREARQQFRFEGFSFVLVAVLYLVVLIALFLADYAFCRWHKWSDLLAIYWKQLLVLQMVVLHVLVVVKLSVSVVGDRRGRRLAFELMASRGAWHSVFGRLFGGSLFAFFLVLLSLPFALFCVLGGGVGGRGVGIAYAVLFGGWFAYGAHAILVSTLARRSITAIVGALALVFVVSALVYTARELRLDTLAALSPLHQVQPLFGVSVGRVFFAGRLIQPFVLTLVFLLFAGYWFLTAAARLLRPGGGPAISRPHGLALLASGGALFALAVRPSRAGDDGPLRMLLLLSVMFVLMLVSTFILVRRRTRPAGGFGRWLGGGLLRTDAPYLPFFLGQVLIYALVWLLLGRPILGGEISAGMRAGVVMALVMVPLLVLFYGLLVKALVSVFDERGRLVAAFLFLLQAVVPLAFEMGRPVGAYSLLQILNPLVLIGAPLGVIETKVGVANFSLCALLCYGSASLLLAGLLKMRRPLIAAA